LGSEDGYRMRVLVMETAVEAAEPAIEALVAAGHEDVRCHEPREQAFPCAGLSGRTAACPVTSTAIDVALTVRAHPRSQPAPLEDGVSCALRSHIPLVVAGSTALHPYGAFVTEVVERADRDALVRACERAAVAPLARHSEVALDAWERTLANHDRSAAGSSVTVTRAHGGLLVTVDSPHTLDRSTMDMGSVRILAALRELDTASRSIDIHVLQPQR